MTTPGVAESPQQQVLLVGAGAISVAHSRVLAELGVRHLVMGRGAASAAKFEEQTGLPVATAGLQALIESATDAPTHAVIAVPVLDLAAVTRSLLQAGVRDVLVEKPIGIDRKQIAEVSALAERTGARVFAAYNRRFHVATSEARRLAEEDGGVRSLTFEFTERSHVVEKLTSPAALKQAWLLANSSHVIDLAFHLGGEPTSLHAVSAGSLPWHDRGSTFVGSGTTETGCLFSYSADWGGPGGWGVELVTARRRLSLRPLERLMVADREHPVHQLHDVDYSRDADYKPGFLEQMRSFLGDQHHLLDVHRQLRRVEDVLLPMRDGTAT